jgi:ankyrin repeat protein
MKKFLYLAVIFLFGIKSLSASPNANYNLVKAADRSDLAGIKKALAAGADINTRDVWYGAIRDRGDTALMKACEQGKLPIAQYLLSQGASVHIRDKGGYSALFYAARGGEYEIVSLLLKKGLPISDRGKYKDSAYVFSIKGNRRSDIIRLLLKHGANPKITNHSGYNLLLLAASDGDTGLIRELLKRGLPVDMTSKKRKTTPLIAACEKGHYQAAVVLLEAGANVNAQDFIKETPLIKATEKGHIKIIGLLIDRGADLEIESGGRGPALLHARNADTVSYLLSRGADINVESTFGNALYSFVSQPEIIQLLIDKGLDVRKKSRRYKDTVLLRAAGRGGEGTAKTLEILLAHGARVDETDEKGNTALHRSAESGRVLNIEILIKYKADINRMNKYGITPLMLAAVNRKHEAVRLLLKKGADPFLMTIGDRKYDITSVKAMSELIDRRKKISVFSVSGMDALTVSLFDRSNIQCVRVLLEQGADPNKRLNGGVTAVMLAAALGHTNMVTELAIQGADLKAESEFGMTAFTLAQHFKNFQTAAEIKQLLKGK